MISGGGVHYSLATKALADFAERHNVPVVETIAGRASLPHNHPNNIGPIGVSGANSANALAKNADVIVAVGTRLEDFSTGSWSAFSDPEMRLVAINTARFDARKDRATALIGDARIGLSDLSYALNDWRAPESWMQHGREELAAWNAIVEHHSGPTNAELPSYAHVIGAINRVCGPNDLIVSAAGGLPGELCKTWRAKSVGSFDCEFGYSCMGGTRSPAPWVRRWPTPPGRLSPLSVMAHT
jgi:3D-(3,5/4)-trihydroxycyclohexane-1,2-dione acylhydrolase (decyclizing)